MRKFQAALLCLGASVAWTSSALAAYPTQASAQLETAAGASVGGKAEALAAAGQHWADGLDAKRSPGVQAAAAGKHAGTPALRPGTASQPSGVKKVAGTPAPRASRGAEGASVGFMAGFMAVESIALAVCAIPIIGFLIGGALFMALLPVAVIVGGVGALIGSPFGD